jgi:hypothetical protein
MFKMSPVCIDTFTQSIPPLFHCPVNNALIKATPLFHQTFFQVIDVTDLTTVNAFLQDPPNGVVNWIEIRAVWGLLLWVDEVWGLCFQHCYSLAGTVSWGAILLESADIARYRSNGW